MKAKLLNLRDALKLAQILEKNVDKDVGSVSVLDFVSGIVEKITPEEYLHGVSLLTGESEIDVKKEISIDILTCFIDGLRENQILSLISFYSSLGLK
jgi:hypothetical protein